MEKEIWKDIKGFESLYQVSNLGRIKSIRYKNERIMKCKPNIVKGYCQAILSNRGRVSYPLVHKLVAAAFIGPCPPGKEVNHKNFIKHDNRDTNLEYLTKLENAQHSAINQRRGDKSPSAKLTTADVVEILQMKGKISARQLGFKYNVERKAVLRIWSGETWKHLTEP